MAKKRDRCLGHSKEPMIHVPFDHVVVDTLHLFLRIMGKLFNQVFVFTILLPQVSVSFHLTVDNILYNVHVHSDKYVMYNGSSIFLAEVSSITH